jgi:hypothetical protein
MESKLRLKGFVADGREIDPDLVVVGMIDSVPKVDLISVLVDAVGERRDLESNARVRCRAVTPTFFVSATGLDGEAVGVGRADDLWYRPDVDVVWTVVSDDGLGEGQGH